MDAIADGEPIVRRLDEPTHLLGPERPADLQRAESLPDQLFCERLGRSGTYSGFMSMVANFLFIGRSPFVILVCGRILKDSRSARRPCPPADGAL